MGIVANIRSFFRSGGGQKVPVVDAMHDNPTQQSIPRSWSTQLYSPGAPVGSLLSGSNARGDDARFEPRSFQYSQNVNSTLSPRAAYGLLPFSELRYYAESVPEVSMSLRIVTEELKAFDPRIIDKKGVEISDPALKWLYTTPDLFNPFPVWLSRFLYNVLVYDAGCVYRPRDSKNHIMALRVIDGSTMFVLINERGEQPSPPAPAFSQMIYGTPMGYYNTYQVWYRPRHLRADAPYGRSPIEDALPAVKLLANLWDYEGKWYTEGTTSEQVFTAPPNWTPDQILEFERAYNARMAGNTEERAGRIRFVPNGTSSVSTKEARFREDVHKAAANAVRMSFGIPQTEAGESPGTGLGGTGFLEAMQNVFYRMCLAPMKAYIESLFNDTLEQNGYPDYRFELMFPKESIDPTKEEVKSLNRFTSGIITRDETRQAIGLKPIGGVDGKFMMTPGGAGGGGDNFPMPMGDMIPVSNKIPVSDKIPVSGGGIPVKDVVPVSDYIPVNDGSITVKKIFGVGSTDDSYYGSPIQVNDRNGVIIGDGRGVPSIATLAGNKADEAVYLLDRVIAPNDQRFLVPVTYTTEDLDGSLVTVSMKSSGRARNAFVDRFERYWIEQAAVLDYIAGVTRFQGQFTIHPDDPRRPILEVTGNAFGSPDSVFCRAAEGWELSQDMIDSVKTVAGDEPLWHDISNIVSPAAADEARRRVAILLQTNKIPSGW